MTQRRGTSTDQLANLIQVLQLGRKTGVLTVERGEGSHLEQGDITFVQGQITEAHAGRLNNQVALNWLKNWGACRFTFGSLNGERPTIPLPSLTTDTQTKQVTRETNPHMPIASAQTPVRTPPAVGTGPLKDTSPVPHRILPVEEALRLLELGGLSRAHRHLFLLIDGHRPTVELARLVGRKPDEIFKLLRDLEYIRVIRQ